MGFGNFFKKMTNGVDHIFKKVDNGAIHMFKKLTPVGNFIKNDIIDKGIDVAKKAGNFLEKNSTSLAAGASTIAGALGQPELIPLIMGAGVSGQSFGSNLNRGASVVQSTTNRVGQMANRASNIVPSTIIKSNLQQYQQQPSNNITSFH